MRTIRILLLVVAIPILLIGNSASAQTTVSPKAQDIYLQAVKSLENRDINTGQNLLEQVVSLDSTHLKANLDLMRIYFAQRNYDGAESLAKRLIKLQPENENNWIALADIYKATESYDELLKVFDTLIELKPDSPAFYYDKAFTLSLAEKFEAALDLYNQIEKKFGVDDRLFAARKDIYMRQDNTKKAIAEAKAYLAFKPEESNPYLMMANLYLDIGEPKDALKILDKAESKFPNEAYIPLTKADAYHSLDMNDEVFVELKKSFVNESLPIAVKIRTIYNILQEYDEATSSRIAVELSKTLVKSHPQQADAQAVYGDIMLQSGKYAEAHAAFIKALGLNKTLDFIWEQLLQLEVSMNKLEDAQKHGLEAVDLFPNNAMILLYTGYAHLLDQKYAVARSFLEEALNRANPDNSNLMVQIYSSLGDTYHALKMDATSNVAYEEALKLDSNNTYVLNNFAYYLALRKEGLSKAASMSKKANEINPDNASFQDTYAWVLFQQENYKEALVWIDKAINLADEPSSTLMEHKGDILYKLGNQKEALDFWKKAGQFPDAESNEKLHQKIKEKTYVD
ncbi:tetratricopeptide repeat protein [Albibacterium sp.]|uniref:tetratricopeptide repeat protein n=1 Tax=Albibacterium sp. TaxID=2952885 RepID=UPI002B63F3CA|nr:tetratricopeptide repeat protein [Albibacterium sp.]HUH19952.1 tetratricopeptide repeat protein [Albibacterium sp.]